MHPCHECGAKWPEDTSTCGACGADLGSGPTEGALARNADSHQAAERERFQAEYGVDIGDRTVDEFLEYIERQDYTHTAWFWVVVVAELAGVGLTAYLVFGPGGQELLPAFALLSVVLSSAIYADTARVRLFEQWAKARWVYVLFPLVPVWGHIAGVVYLLLRRLEREATERARRRLFEAGVDLEGTASPN